MCSSRDDRPRDYFRHSCRMRASNFNLTDIPEGSSSRSLTYVLIITSPASRTNLSLFVVRSRRQKNKFENATLYGLSVPRKCKRDEYLLDGGKKGALVTFSWPTYKLLHWSSPARRSCPPIHLQVLHREDISLVTSRSTFHFYPTW